MEQNREAVGLAALGLFSGARQFENFSRIRSFVSTKAMRPSATPFDFPDGNAVCLPATYPCRGETRSLEGLIENTDTAALLVLKDGAVRYEQYYLTGGREVQWLSMSVAKSFLSALVGIALAEGAISDLDDPVERYAPFLTGSGYEGVSIRHILQMSSGTRWREDYVDPESEIFGLNGAMAPGGSHDQFLATMVRETTPGSLCQYNSADTQALGALLVGATGRSVADYMQEKICDPLGMESPSYWVEDSRGMELAYAGLLMTARDFAKLGELYRKHGLWEGQRIVPEDYVTASLTVAAPHLAAGQPLVGGYNFPLGYGYQWWLPDGDIGEFSAIGVYNQYVYVDPSRGVTIVKLSANPRYGLSHDDEDNKDAENIEAFRAICRAFD